MPSGYRRRTRQPGAFTRTDLVAVMAVVLIVAALQLSPGASTRANGQAATCLSNHRQLVRAWQLYAQDNASWLVGNLDGADVMNIANSNKTWVLGWLDFTGGVPAGSATNALFPSTYSPLATYLDRQDSVFKCPADRSLGKGRSGAPRVRSYSMNGYIGQRPLVWTAGYRLYRKLSEFSAPDFAHAFVFIVERDDSINDGWFAVDMGGFDPINPAAYTIVDYPANWHNRGANLSFVDGHTETWRWQDPRTMPAHKPGQFIQLAVPSPKNPDVARVQAAASRRLTQGN